MDTFLVPREKDSDSDSASVSASPTQAATNKAEKQQRSESRTRGKGGPADTQQKKQPPKSSGSEHKSHAMQASQADLKTSDRLTGKEKHPPQQNTDTELAGRPGTSHNAARVKEGSAAQSPSRSSLSSASIEPIQFLWKDPRRYRRAGSATEVVRKSGLTRFFETKPDYNIAPVSDVSVSLKIYLPDQNEASFEQLQVSLEATIQEAIKRVLEHHLRKVYHLRCTSASLLAAKAVALKVRLSPLCYDLRAHESAGVPFDDLPALERGSEVKEYCDQLSPSDSLEYCLCPVKEHETFPLDPELEQVQAVLERNFQNKFGTSGSEAVEQQEQQEQVEQGEQEKQEEQAAETEHLEGLSEAFGKFIGGYVFKVFLPYANPYTVLPITESTKVYELFQKIRRKQRLPLYREEYHFALTEGDQKNYPFISPDIDMGMTLYSDLYVHGIRCIELKKKVYADTPATDETRRQDERNTQDIAKSRTASEKRSREKKRFDPESFLFNDVTASQYQEWEVVKTNKWSKRQKRVLGVDCQKIYNKRRPKAGPGGEPKERRKTKTSERLISDIVDIQLVNQRGAFRIFHKDRGTGLDQTAVLEYEAEEGAQAAAEIVGKIKYIKKHM